MDLLSGLLFAAVVLLVPATIGVFAIRDAGRRRAVESPAGRGLAAALVVGLLGALVAALLGRAPGQVALIGLLLAGSVAVWAPVARDRATRGLVAWALSLDVGVGYLVYVLVWMAGADLGTGEWVGGVLLWLLEAFVFLIGVGYLWELVDVLARRQWSSYVDASGALPTARRPFVSLHVPTHNEPPDMVIATLESLLALDYDDYEVLLVDNNTDDEALWRPVEAFCAQHDRLRFLHLADWPGYKSGALNEALRVTDPRAEVIGIVDADYLVRPDFLARCAPLLADPTVSFVQTPQDYRDWEEAGYFRRLYYSYGYFFDVSQRSRNERNGAIFGGTMGLIQRAQLEAVGGWDEWCITEDAELSLRLLRGGGRGIHIDQSFGHGIMPLTFEALKRQRYRWCFGGIQILRMHWRSLLPGRRTAANQLTMAQRWAYFVGGLQWFGDLASVLFTGFLLAGAIGLVTGHSIVVRQLSGLILLCLVALVVLGAVRSLALVRRTSGATWAEARGAFGLWLALGLTVARASAKGLVAREGAFLRTPKVRGELGWRHALRGNLTESGIALLCLAGAVVSLGHGGATGIVIGVLLLVHALGYGLAPVNSLAAIRADLPEDLRRRRASGLRSWTGPAARRGGILVALVATTCLGLLVVAAPVGAPDLTPTKDRIAGVVPRISDDTTRHPRPSVTGSATPGASLSATPTPGVPATLATAAPTSAAPAPTSAAPTRTVRATPTVAPTPTVVAGKPTASPTRKPATSGPPTARPTGRP
ncbi:glycosyltransferase family 2 protein [Nocardioides jiangxiensis]|uniref:Glycosyltransferase n=1 Tax=Nocardioides jiangxiensis TaxID=3064524 RepID=A0ABT9B461_9ACTN|nr:glycosyltransferase [Nocardioides sp. WY-20]MDO7869099.1 glycosyltransferase [Nocardioides sp. WY-20]